MFHGFCCPIFLSEMNDGACFKTGLFLGACVGSARHTKDSKPI